MRLKIQGSFDAGAIHDSDNNHNAFRTKEIAVRNTSNPTGQLHEHALVKIRDLPILPFRIPFFRIFYSTTYTVIFIITLIFLAITPGSLLFEAFRNTALQYVFIIGGVYILTAIIAIFIYSSRLYTNRSVLAAVGKAYIPIEDGEIGKSVRKLIVGQLERSAVISWESRPRDVKGEIAFAQKEGLTLAASMNESQVDTIGSIIPIKTRNPPWGDVQHRGWTAPSDVAAELQSDLQFDTIIAELPNLLEARAVSLAPRLQHGREYAPDPRFLEILRRQEKMGMEEYLTQLSYLQLIDLNTDGQDFLTRYRRARFSGVPTSYDEFKLLMLTFGNVMDNILQINPAIAAEIQAQVHPEYIEQMQPSDIGFQPQNDTMSSRDSFTGSLEGVSPVTARTRATTPYLSQGNVSTESFGSVLRTSSIRRHTPQRHTETAQTAVVRVSVSDSDMGSVVHLPVNQ
ncbi:hypothetical protein AMS68_004975 [Peltaster fructicola]|uniref:Defect at low temperature protein 1 n=1 Tax=Peltaster fructicola TaxID=286661 RepID=A0A6H0XXY8_9PEZI|nr:hypothetical protein AMS68_004975 [Peltaster fructicola]